MRRQEDQIQRAVFAHLDARRSRDAFAFAVPNGGYRRPVEAAIMKGLGVRAGVPDIIAVRAGQFYALELKTGSGRLSVVQQSTLTALEAAGAVVGVASGLDEALAWLERHGLLRGRAM